MEWTDRWPIYHNRSTDRNIFIIFGWNEKLIAFLSISDAFAMQSLDIAYINTFVLRIFQYLQIQLAGTKKNDPMNFTAKIGVCVLACCAFNSIAVVFWVLYKAVAHPI